MGYRALAVAPGERHTAPVRPPLSAPGATLPARVLGTAHAHPRTELIHPPQCSDARRRQRGDAARAPCPAWRARHCAQWGLHHARCPHTTLLPRTPGTHHPTLMVLITQCDDAAATQRGTKRLHRGQATHSPHCPRAFPEPPTRATPPRWCTPRNVMIRRSSVAIRVSTRSIRRCGTAAGACADNHCPACLPPHSDHYNTTTAATMYAHTCTHTLAGMDGRRTARDAWPSARSPLARMRARPRARPAPLHAHACVCVLWTSGASRVLCVENTRSCAGGARAGPWPPTTPRPTSPCASPHTHMHTHVHAHAHSGSRECARVCVRPARNIHDSLPPFPAPARATRPHPASLRHPDVCFAVPDWLA